jgi:hypothetical protein
MAATTFENNGRNAIEIASSWTGNWSSVNVTQYVPSARDLALAGPRMFMKLGSFLTVPEAVDNIFGVRMGQRIIPEATGAGIIDAATTAAAGAGGFEQMAQTGTEILVEVDDQAGGLATRFSLEGARSLGSVFSYATSKWALCCIIMAIVLNRTHIYASTRRNLSLPWKVRVLLRLAPIVLLLIQALSLLQSIQCQTSPDFGLLRWGNASKSSDLMFTQNGGPLHTISSTLLFGATDADSCLAVRMIAPFYDEEIAKTTSNGEMPTPELTGSLSRLWPLFQTFSLSQLVETISCAVQGRPVAAETGMTLFEHSLAFAEADAAIGAQIGWGSFGGTKIARTISNSTSEGTHIAITRAMIMNRVNTTPEVLLVGFLSAMNHLTSHILAVFNLQGRLRLINTGFWGLAFMCVIVWSISTFTLDDLPNQSLLRFPTVCIVGFIPHVLVLCGIIACSIIYGAALVLSALAPPNIRDGPHEVEADEAQQSQSSFMRRLVAAHHNMQANVPLSSIRITMHMDFYTALLRTGFSVMTMASEAVYLNESRGVTVKERTWLEEDRLREIEQVGAQWLGPSFRAHDIDSHSSDGLADNIGLVAAKDQPMDLLQKSNSGYAREMTAQKVAKVKGHDRAIRDGVGATERSGRWIMALEFFLGINRLLLSWWASLVLKFMAKIGLQIRPRWLLWLVRRPKTTPSEAQSKDSSDPDSLNFWLLSIDGELTLPKDEHVDVEEEMRNRLRNSETPWNESEEKKLDENLYGWWLNGGWWGSDDNSGNFNPNEKEMDEDITSVVSFSSTAGDEQGWESDENDDGRRTPTQRSPQFSRESTPFFDTALSPTDLAQLLHPKTPEQRAEAQALAAHLASDNIITRSRYRDLTQRERSKVLTSTRQRPTNFVPSSASGKLTPEEEAQILEHLIITRREFRKATSSSQPTSWARGASGMGETGPQCVVCQSSPRSIIVWPCRCLSLCDDCRVTLAMNNFDKCVCCRRDVASFSRVFVP